MIYFIIFALLLKIAVLIFILKNYILDSEKPQARYFKLNWNGKTYLINMEAVRFIHKDESGIHIYFDVNHMLSCEGKDTETLLHALHQKISL